VVRPLRYVLKVLNAENTLPDRLQEVIEILSDFSSPFEVFVIDQGSQDQTEEVGHALARQYPQVHFLRERQRGDRDPSQVEDGVPTSGQVTFIQQPHEPVRAGHLHRQWERQAATAGDGGKSRSRDSSDGVAQGF
jgi:glycosyltransferase involved in cell wall biosynthesis